MSRLCSSLPRVTARVSDRKVSSQYSHEVSPNGRDNEVDQAPSPPTIVTSSENSPVSIGIALLIATLVSGNCSDASCAFLLLQTSLTQMTGKGRKRWSNRWKAALNAFDINFDGRLSAGCN
jgi:hypothetical protein